MSRDYSFIDHAFNTQAFDPDEAGDFEKDLVFVIMPFQGIDMTEVYAAIKDECRKLRLKARRADENAGSGFIIREVTNLIERAEFIVCDLTHERPNVYYELGYAHGVGNESLDILLIAKIGTTLHFDIAPLRVQFYSSTENLRGIISSNLKAMMRATRR